MLPPTENTRLEDLYVSETQLVWLRLIIERITYNITKQYVRQLLDINECNSMAHKAVYEWFMNEWIVYLEREKERERERERKRLIQTL